MRLVVVHYHLRPGGVRRVVELAVPAVAALAPRPVTRIDLVVGEAPPADWIGPFRQLVAGRAVRVFVVPEFRYSAELDEGGKRAREKMRRAVGALLVDEDCLVWVQNPGVGRNLPMAGIWAAACEQRGIPLVFHHHDWWFDNRWHRWLEIRRSGLRSLSAASEALFPRSGWPIHAAINEADARILAKHAPGRALWLPNPVTRGEPGTARQVGAARRWMRDHTTAGQAPVWLAPCRVLRRKNLAEALLLKRWLRPEARLLVTGAASSPDEAPYFHTLAEAARSHRWPLEMGVLAFAKGRTPNVPHLMAASETLIFPSIQEGFGLPYLEAAAVGRPLVARRLPRVLPDLTGFGFRFPQVYDDLAVAPDLIDEAAERRRQEKSFRRWRALLPAGVRRLVASDPDEWFGSSRSWTFSRLTLEGQLEVLRGPPESSWAACMPLNPFLEAWRSLATSGSLAASEWPEEATARLSGERFALRFHEAVESTGRSPRATVEAQALQADFIRNRLSPGNLHPLLWPLPVG